MNEQTVAILGRQPALGLAELESLLGADVIRPLQNAALLNVGRNDFPMARLGGTMKAARLLAVLNTVDWQAIENYLVKDLPQHAAALPEGKVRLGLSLYGFKVNPRQLNATGLTLKKTVKNSGRSVRVVPNTNAELNTAQVIHNQLTGPTGIELVLVRDGIRTLLAQTFAVQDIEAYAARDQKRPKRDARVGMLPPKLAQIIVNLAANNTYGQQHRLLDPFCGTGVVLQEAMLMGFDIYGSDLEPRMIQYSEENLQWLFFGNGQDWLLETGDATIHQWQTPVDFVACETYLGRPFSAEPRPNVLQEVMQDVDTIHRKFLKNVAQQTKPGFRMCIAVPAWKTKNGFKHLKTLENLGDLGYTRVSFAHVGNRDLLYYREDQVVARELVVLIRK